METQQKPRVSYSQFVAQQKPEQGTLASLIERFIVEMNGLNGHPAVKPLGISHCYTLRRIQRSFLGRKQASELTKHDVISYIKGRNESVKPQTALQDVTYLTGVLKYAPSAWDDCNDVSVAPVEAAKPMLTKYQLIGKSVPRKRRPTDEEIERLLAFFEKAGKHPNTKIRMPDMIAFALVSSRRISEICRFMHGDIEWDKKDDAGNPTPMYMVRDLKHPKFKKGNNKRFPLFPELAEIIKRQPRVDPNDASERVFPFDAKSSGASYTRAKKALGIVDLRFHDNRREAITRWLKLLPPHKVKLISGHETTFILERVYDAQKPEGLHAELEKLLGDNPKPENHEPNFKSDY